MVVLHGNQSQPGRARRKQDQQPSDQRTIDWASHPLDILLRPHSPLALADVLSRPGGRFDLIPLSTTQSLSDAGDASSAVPTTEPTPLATAPRKRTRKPRQRANLLTQHDNDELLRQCKRVLVEHALVKVRGQKQLYLTAGFLSWPDPSDAGRTCRSPLLFYPAILARRDEEDAATEDKAAEGVGLRYEIRLEGDVPDMNPELFDRCKAIAGIELPVYDASKPLQDYFAQVASAISTSHSLSLDFDMALGTAATPNPARSDPHRAANLPDLPDAFDPSLAMSVTGNKSLEELRSVLHLLRDYRQDDTTNGRTDASNTDTIPSIARLREYSAKLATQGLEHVEFQHLAGLPDSLERWMTHTREAMNSTLVSDVLSHIDLTSRHVVRLAGMIELIDKAPLNSDQYRHPDLAYAATPALLKRARHQARLIDDELSALQTYFVFDKVPAKKQLLSLIEELGGSLASEPDVVDADYFNARRQFMEFSIEKPTHLTQDHRRLLSQLAKVLRFRELFVNNTEYRQALGPGYRGLRTDWSALEQMTDYARECSDVLESETVAATMLKDWDQFRDAFIAHLDELQQGGEALRKLLRILGPSWQTRPVTTLLVQAEKLVRQLRTWQSTYGPMDSHASRTPASLLSQFSGKSRLDVLTEIHVSETQSRIDSLLQSGDIDHPAVADTLRWLRDACQLAIESQLDIDAIVDHLQIA